MKKAMADQLVETTAGTRMGDYLRDNWVPVMRTQRVVSDGAPQRIKLFGDDFVVFRGSDGVAGIVDEACPHRGASLALARNVDCELQCLYHGWHVARNGDVTAAPTEHEREEFGDRIKTNYYAVKEIGGIIWGYFGPGQEPPSFPMFEWNEFPLENVHSQIAFVNANWLQVLEGVFDPMHVGILHSQWIGIEPSQILQIVCDIEVIERDYGLSGKVMRQIPDAFGFLRVKEFAEPFFGFVPMPAGEIHTCIVAVPADDEHTHMWYINYDTEGSLADYVVNNSHMVVGLENGLINSDNFREPMPTDREGLWGQRRDLMISEGHQTGLPGLVLEDVAILESQGPIQDRTREHLGRSDLIVTKMRRKLLAAAADYAENGRRDDSAVDYSRVRAMAAIHLDGMDWEQTPRFRKDFPEGYPELPSMRAVRPKDRESDAGPGAASFTPAVHASV